MPGPSQVELPWADAAEAGAERLAEADPQSWPVSPGWRELTDAFWSSPEGRALKDRLAECLGRGAVVYPPQPLRALALCAPESVKVVVLGQDPYHGPGQAEGLAFSVAPGVKCPPSLRNIFQELRRDLGQDLPPDGSLVRWAGQGVLLLNTCLTVEHGRPASHAGWGWERLTDRLIAHCSQTGLPKAFLLWGAHAQKKAGLIDAERHLVLQANHPSPLSARRGPAPFLGCGHFGSVNRWLQACGRQVVAW
ncbi:MAG TPA: uracil-DNA glycosylase [Hydrogenophaga sp.]|uniref:uracil-DNA glycosylase n=1 Tax=Hydrogenophaga sp. TaxID=1904254 RepID=UPI002C510C0B|nr:uracil-DNA glycosylase [Hydrogenophaga sp.]HMN92894.1 uracil-DNA glycosylase [Hydrogenophaga sp.]HMP10920.1 uracil-DNA glycosylase [Hydrogenophaga sp.]